MTSCAIREKPIDSAAGWSVCLALVRGEAMADETPEQIRPEEDSKKDTVRINLPPGLTGRSSSPIGAPAAKPAPPGAPVDESKRTTAIMGRSADAPKPKQDTSRVQVAAAKPVTPETPRPTVKLRQEEATPVPAPAAAKTPAAAAPA